MTDLIDTTEMYLRTILELEEEGQTPLRARIAERIGHSGPTVSQTVARMERDGLVVVEEDRHLRLTPKGLERATQVMRKHRLAERLLVDVIGLEWAQVHDEACRWEHVMSEEVERRLVDILDHPHLSPYGNPIPGLDQLGEGYQGGGEAFLDGVVSLPDAVAAGREGPFRVVRLGEVLQTDIGRLAGFDAAGVRPGATVTVSEGGPGLVLQADGAPEALRLEADLARHIYVAA